MYSIGQVVEYHGSISHYHGIYVVVKVPSGNYDPERGYALAHEVGDEPILAAVHQRSISPLRERMRV